MSSNGTRKTETTPKKTNNKFKQVAQNGIKSEQTAPTPPATTVVKPATPTPEDNQFQTKIYDAFLKLSQFNPTVRFEGIHLITSYYNALDLQKNKNYNEYILGRLVKGLASNRKCSRLGFSCALTELFTKFDCLQFETVLEIANKHLKLKETNGKNILTKEEMRHMQIGLAFVYVAFIQSSRLDSINESSQTNQLDFIKSLATDLNEMRKSKEIKPYIQQIYLQALIVLIKKLAASEKVFTQTVYGLIEVDLKEKLLLTNFSKVSENALEESLVKNELNLLMACMNTFPATMKKRLLDANNLDLKKILFSPGSQSRLYEFISQSTESLPKIQPFCTELIEYLVTQEPMVAKDFWHLLIDAKLCSRREPEKKYLSYKIFLVYFSLVSKANFKTIFTESILESQFIVQTLVYNYLNQWSNLNPVCRELMKEFVELVRVKEIELLSFEETCAPLIVKLLSHTKNCHGISDLFGAAIKSLNKLGLQVIYKFLTEEYANKMEDLPEKMDVDTNNNNNNSSESTKDRSLNRYMWIINQLFSMSKNENTFLPNSDLLQQLLTYLLVNSYFQTANDSQPMHASLIAHEQNDKLEGHIRDTLLKYVGVLLAKKEPASNKAVIDLVKSVQDLIDSKTSNNLKLLSSLAEKKSDYKALSATTYKILTGLNTQLTTGLKTTPNDVHCDVVQTFFMVTTFEFFKMFDTFRTSKQVIHDLEVCIEDYSAEWSGAAVEKDVNKPEWIEMLVEMLLNLLTINKAWLRASVKTQFKKLIPKLTYSSVKLVVDLLEIEAENELLMEDEEDSDDGESEMEEEESVENVTNGTNGKAVNGSVREERDDEEEDEDSETEVNNIKLNESLNKVFAEQLDADNNNESDSDLDDETMMKMDKNLAAAFKARMAEKKTDNSKIDFKLKVLDLVQELFKTSYRLDLVNHLIKPMLNILFESQKKPSLKNISQRILGFLVSFKHNLKLLNESRLPLIDEMFETLSFIIECSVTHINVINTLVETSLFCDKIILFIAENSKNEAEKSKTIKKLTKTYVDMIKNEKINPLMYKQFLIRFPDQAIPLAAQVIDNVTASSDVKIFKKTSALLTLDQAVNNQMFLKSSDEQNRNFMQKMFAFLEAIMDEIMKKEYLNLMFVDTFLNLANKSLNLPKSLISRDFCESLAAKATVFVGKEVKTKMKQTHRSRFTNLIHRCENICKNIS